MSVRLCYLERCRRGSLLRAVRLVGQGVDERWPGAVAQKLDSPDSALPWIDRGAEWVQAHLSQSRSAGRLEAIVLDVDGATCSWVAGMGNDLQAVAAAARMNLSGSADPLTEMHSGLGDAGAVSPVTFFAGEESDSTVQPLAAPTVDEGADEPDQSGSGGTMLARLKKPSRKPVAGMGAQRRGILAACDVPGRLFIDALDRRGVEVSRAITLWHAIAQAWDPAWERRLSSGQADEVLSADSVCAVVLVDPVASSLLAKEDDPDAPPPRLIWAWSRGGALLAGGSMRLAHARSENGVDVALGQAEASRLAAEWLAWSMQLGCSPRRVVCVLPDSTRDSGSASLFGSALAKAWEGATVDAAAVSDDPIGATFERLASALEKTPVPTDVVSAPGDALVELSTRPGGAHRAMYKWLAGVVLVASVVMGVVAWQARRSAERINQAASVWIDKGNNAAKAALGTTTLNAIESLRQDVRARERELVPPPRAVPAKPIMEEFETISMVISNEGLALESLDLSSANLVRVTVSANELGLLEQVTKAMRQISGSHVNTWDADYKDFTNSRGEKAYRATLSATWQSDAAGGTP